MRQQNPCHGGFSFRNDDYPGSYSTLEQEIDALTLSNQLTQIAMELAFRLRL
jgi:hypothetical protein